MTFVNKWSFIALFFCIALFSCHGSEPKSEDDSAVADVQTPVTVTGISMAPLVEYTELNATSTFLQKNYVKSMTAGYIQSVDIQLGKLVTKGQLLFVLKTKESQSIGSTINKLDPNFKFSGTNRIVSSASGYITQLNHQVGDYVQDGEQLAVISDISSFAFVLELPYELRPYVLNQKNVELLLPDSTKLNGTISGTMPVVDPASQTQNVIIKVAAQNIPENLIARVKIQKVEKNNAQSLPKAAVLTNDVQDEFWVMKLINDTTAVKVPVQKGLETKDMVEIVSPSFSSSDRILLTGNYGLADTAKVKIEK